MFGPVQPTPYDLQFSLLGIPVRVLPWFWLAAAFLGWSWIEVGPEYLLAWMGVVFVSVLVHEMGHALTAASLGYPPRIMLYHFGGVAMFTPGYNYTQGRSILITLAGPGAGFVLYGIVQGVLFLLNRQQAVMPHLLEMTLVMLAFANLWWGLLNLLPVLPLDGGQVCRDVCTSINAREGERWSLTIALIVAVAVAVWAFTRHERFLGIFFAFLAFQNFEQLQQRRYR